MSTAIAPDAVDRYREILLDMRHTILGHVKSLAQEAVSSTEATALSRSPLSPAENASDAFQQDFSLMNMESEEEILRRIDEALRKLQEGTYGFCAECNDPISAERLEALPFATLCLHCQAELEESGGREGREADEFEILEEEPVDGSTGDEKA